MSMDHRSGSGVVVRPYRPTDADDVPQICVATADGLVQHLRARGIPGLMLTVSATNAQAISFYQKYGFSPLEEQDMRVSMGIRLTTDD